MQFQQMIKKRLDISDWGEIILKFCEHNVWNDKRGKQGITTSAATRRLCMDKNDIRLCVHNISRTNMALSTQPKERIGR